MHARTVTVGLFGATLVVALLLSLLLTAGLGGGGVVADEPPPLPDEEDQDLPPLPDTTPTTPTPIVIESQLAGCAGSYQAVYGFDNVTKMFSRFFAGQPAISNLQEMQAGAGYMVLVTADCTLASGTSTWALSSGWNFIGWR